MARALSAPDNVPICADRDIRVEFLLFHDVLQLTSNFSSFTEQFGMQEMFHGPIVAIAVMQRQVSV